MNKLMYYSNLLLIPVLVILYFVVNIFKAVKVAIRNTIAEVRSDYASNKRYYNM